VSPVALYVIVALLPAAIGGAAIWGLRGVRWLAERGRSARAKAAPPEPLERLGARLRRLRTQLEAMENAPGVPAKALRVRALRAAYVDTLDSACQRLGVTPPEQAERAPLAEIYRVEAALRQRGLDVREPTSR
jgi:hypothetical protein